MKEDELVASGQRKTEEGIAHSTNLERNASEKLIVQKAVDSEVSEQRRGTNPKSKLRTHLRVD